jgi:hypothetical protein
LVTGVDEFGKRATSDTLWKDGIMKHLENDGVSRGDKLRLAILAAIMIGVNEHNRKRMLAAMPEEVDRKVLENLPQFGIAFGNESRATHFRTTDQGRKDTKNRSAKLDTDLLRWELPLAQILKDICSHKKLNSNEYGMVTVPEGTPHHTAKDLVPVGFDKYSKKTGGADANNSPKVVLFVIGGLSYPEIRVAKTLGIFYLAEKNREGG